ncbi:MAG: tetratricopeptide repeat protein, partial [Elusimicrobiota bacterium]
DEKSLKERKQLLEKELSSWGQKLSEIKKVYGAEIETYQKRFDKLNVSIEILKTQHSQEKANLEFNLKNSLQLLTKEISDIRYKYNSEKNEWEEKIQLKESEIKDLQLRLDTREARIKDETQSRLKELSGIIAIFEEQVAQRREEFVKATGDGDEQVNKYKQEIEKLKSNIAKKQEMWAERKGQMLPALRGKISEIEKEISAINRLFKEGDKTVKELLLGKEKQIELLRQEFSMKDVELASEIHHTKTEIEALREDISRIRQSVRYGDEKEQTIQAAIELYNNKDLRGAIKAFNEIAITHPDSEAAYEYLAACYFELGLHSEAAKYSRKVLQINKDNARAKEILREIRNRS